MKQSKLSSQPYKGTRDFLPSEMAQRVYVFNKTFKAAELYGFERYDGPILESADIYRAKSGDEIANQQLYLLIDKGGRELAIRPEMTPSVARIIAANSDQISFPAKWYSWINCHRYERPQRGRLREHWQLNADIFGSDNYEAEIEIFNMVHSLMASLGADKSMYRIRANDRQILDSALKNYMSLGSEELLPLYRIIDSWEKATPEERSNTLQKEMNFNSEQIDRLEELLIKDMQEFCDIADSDIVKNSNLIKAIEEHSSSDLVVFDPLIMRGFNYYTSTVFEVFDNSPHNRRSLFGGGRYNNLASIFTDRNISGIGFGMGDVTAWDFLKTWNLLPNVRSNAMAYIFATDKSYHGFTRKIAQELRNENISVSRSLDSQEIKKGLKHANKENYLYALIVGDDEFKNNAVAVKNMVSGEQTVCAIAEIKNHIKIPKIEF